MQKDKATSYLRPPFAIMEQIGREISARGIRSCVFDGTNMDDLAQRLATGLVESGGATFAVVCYDGSAFSESPRRIARFNVLVVSPDTRVDPGIPGAIDAAWAVEDALDGLVTREGEAPRLTTDVMRIDSDSTVQLKDAGIACAVVIALTVTDF